MFAWSIVAPHNSRQKAFGEQSDGIKPLALERKNQLFCGNHGAAQCTAIIYSLLGSCKINQGNLAEWLTDILNRINDCIMNDLTRLFPNSVGKI
jgi:hypothetical protein